MDLRKHPWTKKGLKTQACEENLKNNRERFAQKTLLLDLVDRTRCMFRVIQVAAVRMWNNR